MNSEQMNNPECPIFILSCVRSGSTLLRYVVDTHPDICSPNELRLGSLCESLERVVNFLSLGQVAESSSPEERSRLVSAEVNRIVSEWMNAYARSRGKRIWCEKSPDNLRYLDTLKRIFTGAKYICLYRNCMDVVHSMFEMARMGVPISHNYAYYARNQSEVSVFVDIWTDRTSKLLAFEQENAGNCLRLRYEELVAAPIKTMNRVFEFIGVDWSEELLDATFSAPHDHDSGDIKILFTREIHQNSIGKGSTIAVRSLTDELRQKMNHLLERLDYPLVGPDWGQSESPYLKAFTRESDTGKRRTVADIAEVFENFFPRRLKTRTQPFRQIKGICKFIVTGDGPGSWAVDLNAPDGEIRPASEEADCTITITRNDLIEMVNGELNPAEAFIHGRVRLAGDLDLAMQVGLMLFST
jgi:protein-tyrosine sulfotransferase